MGVVQGPSNGTFISARKLISPLRALACSEVAGHGLGPSCPHLEALDSGSKGAQKGLLSVLTYEPYSQELPLPLVLDPEACVTISLAAKNPFIEFYVHPGSGLVSLVLMVGPTANT